MNGFKWKKRKARTAEDELRGSGGFSCKIGDHLLYPFEGSPLPKRKEKANHPQGSPLGEGWL